MPSERCVAAALADAIYLPHRNPHATQHLPAVAHPRARRIRLRKAFKNLNPDFLRERAFDPTHAIPEPDDFPLLLDIHWSPPKNDQREHNRNSFASRNSSENAVPNRSFARVALIATTSVTPRTNYH